MTPQQVGHVKDVGDVGAVGVIVAAIMDYAPVISALFAALYIVFRFYEAVDKHIQERKSTGRWPFRGKN